MSSIAITGGATGTGVFSLLAPSTSTNRTINLPDSNGTILTTATAGVPVNGPAFSAYMGSTQTISLATLTKLIFNVERFDTNNCYDPTTNYRFTPIVAGYYQVNVRLFADWSGSQFSAAEIHIYKNGVSAAKNSVASATWYGTEVISDIIYMNGSTDYLEVFGRIAGGSGPQFLGGNSTDTTFSAAMVRAA